MRQRIPQAYGAASNGVSFTVAPSISSLSPSSGAVDTSVTITGTNFGSSQGSSTVTFNGTSATPTSWSDTSIVAPVPADTTTGNVVVTVGGLASNGVQFTVGASVYYYAQDRIGSTRVVTEADGDICFDADYYPYGTEHDYVDNCPPIYKFTGKEWDSESILDNFGARYYGFTRGRFVTPDPANAGASLDNPQSWNGYAYVTDNPETLIDPTGLCTGGQVEDNPTGEPILHCNVTYLLPLPVWGPGAQLFPIQEHLVRGPSTPYVNNHRAPQKQSFASCVESGGDFLSLQHGLQSLTGGRLGDGWISGALLGNEVSAAIGIVQSAFGGDAAAAAGAATGEAVSHGSGPAAVAAARSVPDVLSFPGGLDVPIGAVARMGAAALDTGLNLLGQVKLPYDLTASSFAAVVCSANYY